jgi:hypothetical protein
MAQVPVCHAIKRTDEERVGNSKSGSGSHVAEAVKHQEYQAGASYALPKGWSKQPDLMLSR